MENTNFHKHLVRQLNKICKHGEETLDQNEDFKAFLDSVSKTYKEYDDHTYTLMRSLQLSFEELEALQLKQKNSYDIQLKAMVDAMPDMMFLNNEDGVFLHVFISESDRFHSERIEILGKTYKDIFSPKMASFFQKNLRKAIRTNKLNVIEYELNENGIVEYYEARLVSTGHLVEGKETVISIVRNISKEKKNKLKLQYIATHDHLTKLPNRFYFQKRLKKSIKDAKRKKMQGGLFFFDIDQFKTINDNLGHDIGDKVLIKITKRLNKALTEEDFLARFGGDEFALIVENKSYLKLRQIARNLILLFREPFKIDKYALEVTVSIGICIFPDGVNSSTELLKRADIAMYKAKDLGRNVYKFFTNELAKQSFEKFDMEGKLKKSIENNELYLMYQPQVRLSDSKIAGVEALIRWQSDTLISPAKFIPFAEACGYIESISNWVIEEVCKQVKQWEREAFQITKVSINLSRQELGHKNLVTRVINIIEKYEVSPSLIELEVTETALFDNTDIAFNNISTLRSKGFLVSIDDFGTGYSSLSNLKESLFDKLKIDRSFITGIGESRESEYIIRAIMAIAKSLHYNVLAEGVETLEQLEFLRKHHCDEIQGYYYSKPILAKEVIEFYTNFSIYSREINNYQI